MALAYWFTPPVRLERFGDDPLWSKMDHPVGITVIKIDGVYGQYPYADPELFDGAEAVYLGGHRHRISSAEAADLTEAGYGEFITEGDSYGAGSYGEGDYS